MLNTSPTVTLFQKPSPGITEVNCRTSASSLLCTLVKGVDTHVEVRRASSSWHGGVHLYANTASPERVLVARVPALPIEPNLVDHLHNAHVSLFLNETVGRAHRMVKEEHRICVRGTVECMQIARRTNAHHLETTSVLGSSRGFVTQTDTNPTYPLRG